MHTRDHPLCPGLSCPGLCGSTPGKHRLPNAPIASWLSVMVIRPFATALWNLLLISCTICIMTIHLADATPLLPVRLLSLHHLHLLLLLDSAFYTRPGERSLFHFSTVWFIGGRQAYRWGAGARCVSPDFPSLPKEEEKKRKKMCNYWSGAANHPPSPFVPLILSSKWWWWVQNGCHDTKGPWTQISIM